MELTIKVILRSPGTAKSTKVTRTITVTPNFTGRQLMELIEVVEESAREIDRDQSLLQKSS